MNAGPIRPDDPRIDAMLRVSRAYRQRCREEGRDRVRREELAEMLAAVLGGRPGERMPPD